MNSFPPFADSPPVVNSFGNDFLMSDHRQQPHPPTQNESSYQQRPLSWVPNPVYPPTPATYEGDTAGLFGKKSSVQSWLAKMTTNSAHEDPEVFGTAAAMSHGDVQL